MQLFNMPWWRERRARRLLSAGTSTAAPFPERGMAQTYRDTHINPLLPPSWSVETLSQPCPNRAGIRTAINTNCRKIEWFKLVQILGVVWLREG